jgi:hypothetical protein
MNPLRWLKLRKTRRAPLVHSILIMIGATYLEVAIYMMILWRPPTLEQYFGAALLGWACALIAYTRLQRRAMEAEQAAANA